MIAKRAASAYAHRRSPDWLKFKCVAEQELVIGGWTDPEGARSDFGALLVGYYDDDGLVYAGKVGTGYDDTTLRRLGARLRRLARARVSVCAGKSGRPWHHWVRPTLVARVRVYRVDPRRKTETPSLPRAPRRQAGPRGETREARSRGGSPERR